MLDEREGRGVELFLCVSSLLYGGGNGVLGFRWLGGLRLSLMEMYGPWLTT